MKRWLCFVLVFPVTAPAQTGWTSGFARAVQSVKSAPQNQLPPQNPKVGQTFQVLHADTYNLRGDTVELAGQVHAQYKGYDIYADRLTGSRTTQAFRLEGDARLIGETETINGAAILVDFKTRNFSFEDGRARLKPERLEKRTQGDVFVRAESGAGTEFDFTTENGLFTTCELERPHFGLIYDTTRVLPGRRAELRRVGIQVLGRTILKIPMLVVPLNRRAPKYLPEVGQSVDEGYYVKTRISTPLHGESYLDTRVDLMTKQGAGLGLDYNYLSGTTRGLLSVYGVTGGNKSRILNAQHEQRFGLSTLTLNTTYQRSDYLTAPGSTVWNTLGQFNLPWGGGTTRLTYTRYTNESTGFRSTSEVLGLGDDRSIAGLSSRLELSRSLSDSGVSGGSSTKSERIDVRYGATATAKAFSADLVYQRSIPVGRTENFYSSSDVTPMLSLRTSAEKLWGNKLDRFLPFNFEASIGELTNPSSTDQNKVTRIFFDLGFRRNDRKSRATLDWGSRIRQGLYSDDTAQYVLNNDARFEYRFARESSASVTYNYLRGFGYTPLAVDSTGRSDALTFDLNYSPSKPVKLSLQTGYDILQGSMSEVPWQFVWLRSQWKPGPWMEINASASYDTFRSAWSNLRLDSDLSLGQTRLMFGARYDGLRSQWSGFNVLIEGFKVGRINTSVLLDYNGYSQNFDSQHYRFAYDLHCTEAVFEIIDNQVGFRSGRTFAFYFRIKALPTDSGFGSGTRGQSIGGSYGFGD